jgi:glutaminyl-peptide cyclotransferase
VLYKYQFGGIGPLCFIRVGKGGITVKHKKVFTLKNPVWVTLVCLAVLPVVQWAQSADGEGLKPGRTPLSPYRVIRSYPHDRQAFTQGLVFEAGFFYEGTGLRGRSSLRKVDPVSGRILKEIRLEPSHFGEGITVFGNRIVQLTWQSHVGFVYDKNSFRLLRTFAYPQEGWGVTHDGERLIRSDGTSILYFLDLNDFREVATVGVHDERGPVAGLNELEYVQGVIYANVWPTDRIAVIHPRTGRVEAWMDLKGLLGKRDSQGVDVLNGIAYDNRSDRLFVTGKLWPKVFEIQSSFRPRQQGRKGSKAAESSR